MDPLHLNGVCLLAAEKSSWTWRQSALVLSRTSRGRIPWVAASWFLTSTCWLMVLTPRKCRLEKSSASHLDLKMSSLDSTKCFTVIRELRIHELSQSDLVTLYQLRLLVWENYYIVYVHLISLRGILLYKIHYKICLSFRATCKGLLKHGIEKEEECSVNIKPY